MERGGETVLHGGGAWNCESETGQDGAGQGRQEEREEGVGWERTSEECETRRGGEDTDGGSGDAESRGRGGG